MLNIECANGQQLPYLGCIEAEITITTGLERTTPQHCIFLVAPDTKYSNKRPVILGTNILMMLLQNCKYTFGAQFLQKAKLPTPWYMCFKFIIIRDKRLKKNNDRLAVVRNMMAENIILKPNETKTIRACADKQISEDKIKTAQD